MGILSYIVNHAVITVDNILWFEHPDNVTTILLIKNRIFPQAFVLIRGHTNETNSIPMQQLTEPQNNRTYIFKASMAYVYNKLID